MAGRGIDRSASPALAAAGDGRPGWGKRPGWPPSRGEPDSPGFLNRPPKSEGAAGSASKPEPSSARVAAGPWAAPRPSGPRAGPSPDPGRATPPAKEGRKGPERSAVEEDPLRLSPPTGAVGLRDRFPGVAPRENPAGGSAMVETGASTGTGREPVEGEPPCPAKPPREGDRAGAVAPLVSRPPTGGGCMDEAAGDVAPRDGNTGGMEETPGRARPGDKGMLGPSEPARRPRSASEGTTARPSAEAEETGCLSGGMAIGGDGRGCERGRMASSPTTATGDGAAAPGAVSPLGSAGPGASPGLRARGSAKGSGTGVGMASATRVPGVAAGPGALAGSSPSCASLRAGGEGRSIRLIHPPGTASTEEGCRMQQPAKAAARMAAAGSWRRAGIPGVSASARAARPRGAGRIGSPGGR